MKKNRKHKTVDNLPNDAMLVSDFCKERGFTTSYVYKLIRLNKNSDFDIVIFKGINFIIPK